MEIITTYRTRFGQSFFKKEEAEAFEKLLDELDAAIKGTEDQIRAMEIPPDLLNSLNYYLSSRLTTIINDKYPKPSFS